MLENLVKLQEHGGVNLGPIGKYLTILQSYFDIPPKNIEVTSIATETQVGDTKLTVTATSIPEKISKD